MAIFLFYMIFINKKVIINMRTNRIRLTESQLHRVIKESVKRVLKEHDNLDGTFYRVQLCYDEGGEASNGEDFPTYAEAIQYLRSIEPEMGEHVEIYKMRENANQVDFIDQM